MNLKELAQYLGLSQTTVSRALNGYPEVSEATRLRVAAAAKEHNYRANARAKGLATGRSHAIGHVIPVSNSHEMMNPVFGDFIAGAGETYAREGFDMLLSVVPDAEVERAYRDMAAKGNVDGVIMHAPKVGDARIDLLRDIGLPFAVHGRSSAVEAAYTWLDVNNKNAFQRATEFLLDLGHQRIALLNGLETMDFAHRRRQGFEAAFAARGVTAEPRLMRSEEMTEVYGYATTLEMLGFDAPPTAVLTSSMITAIGVRRAVQERGLVLGRDVSVITHDDALSYLSNGEDVPQFTATRSSVREAGGLLAQMLIDQIRHPEQPPATRLLEAQLTVGRSTGPVPR